MEAAGNWTPVSFALTSGCFLDLRQFTPIECTALENLGEVVPDVKANCFDVKLPKRKCEKIVKTEAERDR